MAHDFENIDDLDDLSDAELRSLVRDRLAEHRGLDLRDITVQVHNGVVELSGRVGTEGERRIAERVGTDTIGLPSVRNDIVVESLRRAESPEAADDAASQAGADGRLRLASALIKVARLAPGPAPALIPTSALYCGERLEGRIRRLLEPFGGHREPTVTWRSRLTLCLGVAASALVLEGVHAVIESAIHTLP